MRPVELGVVPVALGVVIGEAFVADLFVVALLGVVPAEVVPATFVPGAPVAEVLEFPTPGVLLPTLEDVELGTHGRVCVLLLIPVGVVVVPPIGVVPGIVVVPGVVVLLGNVVLFGVVDGLIGVVLGLCGVTPGLCGVVAGLCSPGLVVVVEVLGVVAVPDAPAVPACAAAIPAANSTVANTIMMRVFIHSSPEFWGSSASALKRLTHW